MVCRRILILASNIFEYIKMSTTGRPVYGTPSSTDSNVVCFTLPSLGTSLDSLDTMVKTFTVIVDKFFPLSTVSATRVAKIEARITLPDRLFVRLEWRTTHPGVVFTGSPEQLYEIKDIYIRNGLDWTKDRLFAVPV